MTVQILCLGVLDNTTTAAAQTSCKKVPDTQSIQITMFNSLSYLLLPTYLGKWENNCILMIQNIIRFECRVWKKSEVLNDFCGGFPDQS